MTEYMVPRAQLRPQPKPALQSVPPFLQDCLYLTDTHTDTQTDRPCYIDCKRPHLCTLCIIIIAAIAFSAMVVYFVALRVCCDFAMLIGVISLLHFLPRDARHPRY